MTLHLSLLLTLCIAQPSVPGLRVPPGFVVTEYADSTLANDIVCMTIDPHGRLVVAGRGYLRVLVDDDGDGKAERALELAKEPKDGAMGLLWEGDTLYAVGDGGLRRATIRNDRAGPFALVRALKTGGEHAAHALARGPDGWLYLLCGNHAGIDQSFAQTPASPIADPTSRCLLRFSPDLKTSEIVAHGFRNPYGMDFNTAGDLFTFDSDNERCVSLPWYEPTRLYRVRPGRHYGWQSPQHASFWRRPPYFFDVEAPLATLGRGSPTGVACYRHTQFPPAYRDGLFLCDWTFGKLHFATLTRDGASYTATTKLFLEATGDNGFAPTAAVVHPKTGDLFIAIGGRGTRGAVYRVRYPEGKATGPLAMKARHETPLEPSNGGPLRLDDVAKDRTPAQRLEGIRRVQLALGDIGDPKQLGTIWEGYTLRKPCADAADLARKLAPLYPSGHADLDRELSRTLAMLAADDAALRGRVVARLGPDSDPVEDIHTLAVFARLPGERSADERRIVADALLALDAKLTRRKLQRDTNWLLRVRELCARLFALDDQLATAMLNDPDFGRPDHALFASVAGFPKERAAAAFLAKLEGDADYPLRPAAIAVLRAAPADRLVPLLRRRWADLGSEALLPLLARQPLPVDRPKFVEGCSSPQPAVVRASLAALARLDLKADADEILALVQALRRQTDNKELRAALAARLAAVTGQSFGNDAAAWSAWFGKRHPRLARRLDNPDGVDLDAWNRRLARLDWNAGDAERGKAVFAKASCLQCHSGSQALGPDLHGVATRFSRADLLTALLQPSRDVPERYRTTAVETAEGKTYQGLVIYDAADSLILQTGAGTTVRLDSGAIVSRRVVPQSPMPAGLLDPLGDGQIVDLVAYLRGLGAGRE